MCIRDRCSSIDAPYELLVNPAKMNAAGQRVLLERFGRSMGAWAEMIGSTLCDPVWRWVIEAGIRRKEIPPSKMYQDVSWIRPRRMSVDIVRESAQVIEDLAAGITTLEADASNQGLDWRMIRKQREVEFLDAWERSKTLAEATEQKPETIMRAVFGVDLSGGMMPKMQNKLDTGAENMDDSEDEGNSDDGTENDNSDQESGK